MDEKELAHRGGIIGEKITASVSHIDKKALAGAVGVMLLSWAGLPIVYWLIVRKKKKEKEVKK